MIRSMKKSVTLMLAMFVLVFALAVPAFADASNYEFLDPSTTPPSYSTHANSFASDAVISGSSVTVSYDSSIVTGLKVNTGSGYTTLTGTVSGGVISFTFNVTDFDADVPVKLGVNAGPHSGDIDLIIHWTL
jgi:ABC-type oligopeptide transport system substrate-binding subunit